MGWCSGTEIFDKVVGILLEKEPLDKKGLIKEMITLLEDADWDCQSDSDYINHPLVREAFIEVDPEWAEYFKEMDE